MLTIPQNTTEVILPDLTTVTIREQNGADDEILSKMKNSRDNSAVEKFLANIIVSVNPETDKPWTYKEIAAWRSNKINYLVLCSRIFSLGETITFKFRCPECGYTDPREFEEDLTNYTSKFDNLKPVSEFPYVILPFVDKPGVLQRTLELASGKKIRYKFRTGLADRKSLEIPEEEVSLNTLLAIRELELETSPGKWLKLQNYEVFTSRDMKEIREDIKIHDPIFNVISEITCTNRTCKKLTKVNMMEQPDFFFPGAI
jgi:hypothetical protein